jgi:hypothetical protein
VELRGQELRRCFTSGVTESRGKTIGRFDRGARKHRVSGMCLLELQMDNSRKSMQYVKQETMTNTDSGREARATRLITERASRRIGQTAFELALARPRKVSLILTSTMLKFTRVLYRKSPSFTNPTFSLSQTGYSGRPCAQCPPSLKFLVDSMV